MKRQISVKAFIITIIFIVLFFAEIIMFLFLRDNPVSAVNDNVVNLEFGDSMSGFRVADANGELLEQLPESDKYSIVFYLSDSCGTCMDILKNFNKIESILGKEDINYIVLWTKEIPVKILDKYHVDSSFCYSLLGETQFATSTPSFFILDNKQEVVFSTVDAQNLISKIALLDIVSTEQLKENTIDYIKENVLSPDSDKKQIVYFEMEGCPDCKAANEVIESEEIADAFEIIRIYKYDDKDADRVKDDYGLYKLGLDIQWYPSFLVFEENDVRFVGEVPIEELKNNLMK